MVEIRPGKGAAVLHCGHIWEAKNWHWFNFEDPAEFLYPDGCLGESFWQVACDGCFTKAEGDPTRMPADECAIWNNDEPIESLDPN